MTTVSQVNPIRAYFNISESDYLGRAQAIARLVRGGRAQGKPIPIEFIQTNGITFPAKGKIVLVNREIASQTGTIQIAAEFPNKEGILRPGGFGNVRIETGTSEHALLVPQAAVIEVQSMYQVVVVSPENKAMFRPVKVGRTSRTELDYHRGTEAGREDHCSGLHEGPSRYAGYPEAVRDCVRG